MLEIKLGSATCNLPTLYYFSDLTVTISEGTSKGKAGMVKHLHRHVKLKNPAQQIQDTFCPICT